MRFVVGLLVLLVACTKPTPRADDKVDRAEPAPVAHAAKAPRVVLSSPRGDQVVYVEVVQSDAALEKGLMYRQFLPPDDGMLFLMPDERDWTFYMRNTLIPLDMIFITKDMTVAGIVQNATPLTEDLRSVGAKSVYVLETNGAWTASHGVSAGAKVRFENTEGAAR